MEEDDDARLETQLQSANGTWGQTSGSGRPLVHYQGLNGSSVGPHGRLQLLGGPLKPGLSEDPQSSNLGSGLVGLDPVFSSSFEAGSTSFGPTSLEDPRWVKAMEAFVVLSSVRLDDCRGTSQSLEGNRAHIGVAFPSVWFGPSLLRGPDVEISHFWVKDGLQKQIEEEL